MPNQNDQFNNLPWHVVEKAIADEILWLKTLVVPWSSTTHNSCDQCNELAYRKLAVMIVTGSLRARELRNKTGDFFGKFFGSGVRLSHKHGKDWHRQMMTYIDHYFTSQGYDITTEPILNSGRADLGVFYSGKKDLYVEVGTISIYKLWVNIATMKNCVFLCVPDEHHILEFEV